MATSRRASSSQLEVFVLACVDGKFLLVSRLGRVEKTVDAHKGAVLGARWSGDTTALLTCMELSSMKLLIKGVPSCRWGRWFGKDLVKNGHAQNHPHSDKLVFRGHVLWAWLIGVVLMIYKGSPIYSACWSPDCDHVLYATGKTLVIKPLQSGLKPVQWTAHDGLILCIDWSHANNFIISGGEDRKYKVKI